MRDTILYHPNSVLSIVPNSVVAFSPLHCTAQFRATCSTCLWWLCQSALIWIVPRPLLVFNSIDVSKHSASSFPSLIEQHSLGTISSWWDSGVLSQLKQYKSCVCLGAAAPAEHRALALVLTLALISRQGDLYFSIICMAIIFHIAINKESEDTF